MFKTRCAINARFASDKVPDRVHNCDLILYSTFYQRKITINSKEVGKGEVGEWRFEVFIDLMEQKRKFINIFVNRYLLVYLRSRYLIDSSIILIPERISNHSHICARNIWAQNHWAISLQTLTSHYKAQMQSEYSLRRNKTKKNVCAILRKY